MLTDNIPDLFIPQTALPVFDDPAYFLAILHDDKGGGTRQMHFLGQVIDRLLMPVHHDDADLLGWEGGGIHQGIEFWQQVLGVFTPGAAENHELYLRPLRLED